MAFKIEKKVAVPSLSGRPRKYPFPDMKVGDSFKCDENPLSVRASASLYGYRNGGAKFTIRKTPDGYRCWRIA